MSRRDDKNLWEYGAHAPGPPMSGHVLVGVDGSDQARRALDREAAVPRMTVAAARGKFPDVGVRVDTVWTGGAAALVEASRTADLAVITARHRHGRGLGPHTGSFTHALLHRSHCPVALVPVGSARPEQGRGGCHVTHC